MDRLKKRSTVKPVQNFEECDECGRKAVVARGAANHLEAALDVNGSPVLIQEWAQVLGKPPKGSSADPAADFAEVLDNFLYRPHTLRENEINDLDEFWELKAGTLRMPFFDIDCGGGVVQALDLPRRVKAPPSTAKGARATHLFWKTDLRAGRRNVERARGIKRGDQA